MRRFRHLVVPAIALVAMVALDLATKALAVTYLAGKGVVRVVGELFVLQLQTNSGAFLSLGADLPDRSRILLFVILPIIALGLLVFALVRRPGSIVSDRAEGVPDPDKAQALPHEVPAGEGSAAAPGRPIYFEGRRAELWGAALLVAGGFGNLWDRIAYGQVRDFMNFGLGGLDSPLRTGVLNLADLYLTSALLVILGASVFRKRKGEEGDGRAG